MNPKWYLKEIDGESFVYHRFSFKPEIQNCFFIGNEFIGMNISDESGYEDIMNRVIDAGKEGLLPDILSELKTLIGESNCEYDGYEIGEDEFSHYFFIRSSSYKIALSKIMNWRHFNELNELMYWEEREI